MEIFDKYKTINRFSISLVSAEEFYNTFQAAKESYPQAIAWRVDTYTKEAYEQMVKEGAKLYVTEHGSTLAIKASGEMISLCTPYNEKDPVDMHEFVQFGALNGGTYFSCYDLYAHFFEECQCIDMYHIQWNDQFAPDDWMSEYGTEKVHMFVTELQLERYKDKLEEIYQLPKRPSKKQAAELMLLTAQLKRQKQIFKPDSLSMNEILEISGQIQETQKKINKIIETLKEPVVERENRARN